MRGISSRTSRLSSGNDPTGTLVYVAPERFVKHLDLAHDTKAAKRVDVYRLVDILI